MGKKYFGTDGIRGVVSHPPLDDTTVYAIGAALGGTLQSSPQTPNVLIGMDTRESGPRIASLLAGGLRQAGAEVVFAGVITTPAVATTSCSYTSATTKIMTLPPSSPPLY